MMSNRFSDILFQLIHSLEKAEKRHFKLYIKRSSANEDLKIVQLFDAIDKLQEYDEKLLLKKLKRIEKPQLANLKAHLYKQILASLRLLKITENIDIQLNEQLDYARILYNKGLKLQALKITEKAKETARANHKFSFLIQVITLEKKIETLHITRSSYETTANLAQEAIQVSSRISRVAKLSNLALLLYNWYVRNGHARNKEDEKNINEFFKKNIPPIEETGYDFYEKLYLYQSYVWYAFIKQDFLQYYRYSQKWVDLFDAEPFMIEVELGHYIKGMHNLVTAHFDLRNVDKFEKTLAKFEAFGETDLVKQHDNFNIHTFIYIYYAKVNEFLMKGNFGDAVQIVPYINTKLEEYAMYIDRHRILVFNYKIATLYFGNGDYATCIDYLQNIINEHISLKNDLQCYARLMHLMCHYELGNVEIMDSLLKSVQRFMSKMQNVTVLEEEMFKFIRKIIKLSVKQAQPEFAAFLNTIKQYERSRFETRAFAYLDVISWVESKVHNTSMSTIIQAKFKALKQLKPKR
jgi:hypothetical protein